MSKKQRIFLSGTDHVKDVMNQLYGDLNNMGFEPVWFRKEDFPFFDKNAMDACLDAVKTCDKFIFILDERAGLTHKKIKSTISEAEFNVAFELELPTLVFIRDRVWHQSRVYHKKRVKLKRCLTSEEFLNAAIDGDLESYEIIERLQHKKRNNKLCVPWITSFELADKISTCIREKWLVLDELQVSAIEGIIKLSNNESHSVSPDENAHLRIKEKNVAFSSQAIKKIDRLSKNKKNKLLLSLELIKRTIELGAKNPLQVHKLVGSNLLSFRLGADTRVLFKKENKGIEIIDIANRNA